MDYDIDLVGPSQTVEGRSAKKNSAKWAKLTMPQARWEWVKMQRPEDEGRQMRRGKIILVMML